MEKIILDYLLKLSDTENVVINYDTELIDSAIIDSLGIISLISYIEEKFHIVVEETDFEMDNFNSVKSIVSFVKNKKGVL